MALETVQEIHVDSRSRGCYQKQTSSFHMNLPGINLPKGRDLFVNVSDFTLPVIEKNLSFVMYYGLDTLNIEEDAVKEYNFVFSSLTQFATQLHCAVVNDFIYKSKCVEKEGDLVGGGRKDDVDSVFYVRFMDGMFQMQLDENCVLFASDNLFQFMAFYDEVYDAKNGSNKEKVLAPAGNTDFMKVCKRLTFGAPKNFFSDSDRVCHLVIDNCLSPVACFDGGRYNVICSYDLEKMKIVSNYRKFFSDGLRNISFSVLDNNFKPFDFGCCLKNQSLRFVLNVVAKI